MIESFFSMRWYSIWRRNARVWQKLMIPSMLMHFGEPFLFLLILGYGLGNFIGEIDGLSYLTFLASGIVCSSAMNSATFEAMYGAYTRMAIQNTWQSMLATSVNVSDVLLAEAFWGASKSLISVTSILIVSVLIGVVTSWQAIWVLPLMFLVGLCFSAMALVMTALARSYDFFMYYSILVVTPLMLLSGVYFPLDTLPPLIRFITELFPLAHVVQVVRPLMTGQPVDAVFLHVSVVLAYTLLALSLANWLLYRRLN